MRNYFPGQYGQNMLMSSHARKYILFVIIGGFCFLIDISTLTLFREVLKVNIYMSIGIAFIFATYINYLLNIRFVFKNGKFTKAKEVSYFFLASGLALLLTFGSMQILIKALAMNYLLAKAITVFVVSIFSFSVRNFVVFQS